MIFDNLDTNLQNVILYNYESSTKFFVVLLIFALSFLYLFYIRYKFKETLNPITAVVRVVLWISSWVFLYASPLMYIFYLAPGYSFNTLILFVLTVYSIIFVTVTAYVVWNFALLLPLSLLKVGLLSPEKFKNTLFKNLNLDKLKIK